MNKEIAVLKLNVRLISLIPQEIEFRYNPSQLENLDQLTFFYRDRQDFFDAQKTAILNKIQNNLANYEVLVPPTSIELVSNEMLVEIGNKKIPPLFQKVKIGEKYYNTLDVANKRLMQGRMKILYEADQRNQDLINYKSIFRNVSPDVIERIRTNQITLQDLKEFWIMLQHKRYVYSIIRFILSNDTILNITMEIETKKEARNEESRQRKFWLQYKD